MSEPGIVIVGAGQAGISAAEALRAGGYAKPVIVLGEEDHAPYHRPPLSKAWLAGEIDAAQLLLRPAGSLERKHIDVRLGARAVAIDRAARRVRLADGTGLPYEGLLLATGARARRLPGVNLPHVHVLRTRDDADAIGAELERCVAHAQRLVVVGGGFIGLEVASTARRRGVPVTVLEAAPRLLSRVATPVLSEWFAKLHAEHGVEVFLNAHVASIERGAEGALTVRLGDGRRLYCGLVVVGIGIEPEDTLAREAGLPTDRGVIVDACGRTADAHIAAAGDCTARRLPDGTLLRLESVHNATEQGRCAAAALMGQERPFAGPPWFWSDQFGRKLQIAGVCSAADQSVVRGSAFGHSFSIFHLHDGKLVAADSIDASKEHLLARKLLEAGVSPTAAQIADTAFDLASLLPAR